MVDELVQSSVNSTVYSVSAPEAVDSVDHYGKMPPCFAFGLQAVEQIGSDV